GGTGLMPVSHDGIPDEAFELRTFQITGHHLAPGERPKCRGVAYLATEFHAGYHGLQVVWMRQQIRLNLDGVQGIGSHQTELTSAFGPCDGPEQCPAIAR